MPTVFYTHPFMIIRFLLITISFGLLIWLFFESVSHLDIAETKNDILLNRAKSKVDKMQSIDSLKIYTKSKLDVMRQDVRNESLLATKRMWLIIALIFTQVFLLFIKQKKRSLNSEFLVSVSTHFSS